MSNATSFCLSKHAIDRLRERFPEQKEWLQYYDKINENALRVKARYEFMQGAKEEKAFLNDTRFMMGIYDRYGYDRHYRIFVKDGIILIGVEGTDGNVIATAIPKNEHYSPHIKHSRKKFTKREAKHGNQ